MPSNLPAYMKKVENIQVGETLTDEQKIQNQVKVFLGIQGLPAEEISDSLKELERILNKGLSKRYDALTKSKGSYNPAFKGLLSKKELRLLAEAFNISTKDEWSAFTESMANILRQIPSIAKLIKGEAVNPAAPGKAPQKARLNPKEG